jgi:hypothetical protein
MPSTLILLVVFSAEPAAHAAAPLAWKDNYTQALEETKNTDKPLLVVVHDPTDPELLARHATDRPDATQTELLKRYELCRVDVSTEHGQRVAEAFSIEQLPFLAVIDKTGSGVLHQHSGQLKPEDWVEKLVTYREGNLPATRTGGTTSGSRTTYARPRRSSYNPATCYT